MLYRYLRRLLLQTIAIPVFLLTFMCRRDRRLWVFGSWHGKKYSDNSKYLFEYICNNVKDIQAIWITDSKEVYGSIRALGYPVEMSGSVLGAIACMKAGAAIFTHDVDDVSAMFLGGALLINLTHGAPMKRIGLDARLRRAGAFTGMLDRYLRPLLPGTRRPHYVVVSSGEMAVRFSSALNVSVERILPLGYPRWKPILEPQKLPESLERYIIGFQKVFLYAPTHRKAGRGTLDLLQAEGFDDFVEWLKKSNACLLVRPHSSLKLSDLDDLAVAEGGCLRVVDSDMIADINLLLPKADCLISDYSSVIYDYLILRRPVISLVPDLLEYMNSDAGLYEPYDKAVPGPIVESWAQIPSAYLKALSQGDSVGAEEFRRRFVRTTDRSPCKSIEDFIREQTGSVRRGGGDIV